jgi:DNA polymerase III subunit chi
VVATQADFYLVSAPDEGTRLRTACAIAGKAYDKGLRVTVLARSPAEAAQFDDLLWTFRPGSFVPHGLWPAEASFADATPVLISSGELPESHRDVLVNLGVDAAGKFVAFDRICEVVGPDDSARRTARSRWRQYSAVGIEPASHDIGGR